MSVSGLLLPRLKTASGDAFIREPMMPLAMSVTKLHKRGGRAREKQACRQRQETQAHWCAQLAYVKSRCSVAPTSLGTNTGMASPRSIICFRTGHNEHHALHDLWAMLQACIHTWLKKKYAMSGRPHGPYTVKKRRPVTLSPYMSWKARAINCATAHQGIGSSKGRA